MSYEIYVISNADLFREALNAIAAFCQSKGFHAAIWIGSLIGIMMTGKSYVQSKDLTTYVKWLATYMVVFNGLIATTSSVIIINTSDPSSSGYVVDNVPLGIAYPAHLVTALGYSFSKDLETAFSLPQEEQYHKTGMLFGSKLFQLSLRSNMDDPEIMNNMNNYIKSCVVGDILINHKYTLKELLHSTNLWELMTSQPSPIRGMFVDGKFMTCKQSASMLTEKMNNYTSDSAIEKLTHLIGNGNAYSSAAISNMLGSSYQYFKASSDSASQILKQNIAINAFRSGLKNYAAEVGSVAAMENTANTMAMDNTRMAWANSRNIGVETLPLMQVVLLLLMLCLFPFIATLAMLPDIGVGVLKNYIYSLLWLEMWPIMYTILNMAMNFYLKSGSHGTVTLSSINQLAQEHSDIMGIAGYLVLAIPFLSMGVVKGMAATFNGAAQYLGGMMHSIAQGSSSSVAMGNYSLGNISTANATANNLSANKHDTNFTDMHGMSTHQLSNASTLTDTASGASVYNTHGAMSHLATNINAAQSIASSLSRQVDSSLTSAFNNSTSYSHSKGHNDALGHSIASSESANVNHAMNTINSMTHSLAQKEGISERDAFQRLSKFSMSLGADASAKAQVGFSALGNGAVASASTSIKSDMSGLTQSTHEGGYTTGIDKNITSTDAKNFSDAISTVSNYSKAHTYSDQNTQSENLAIQMGSNLSNAQRFSDNASYVQSHSASVNSGFAQNFSHYVRETHPEESEAILSATEGPMLDKQMNLANDFVKRNAEHISDTFKSDISRIRHSDGGLSRDMDKYVTQNYHSHSSALDKSGSSLGLPQNDRRDFPHEVSRNIQQTRKSINSEEIAQSIIRDKNSIHSDDGLEKGKGYAQKGIANHTMKELKELV